jgi:dolichol-phosphate mannosyltransferase
MNSLREPPSSQIRNPKSRMKSTVIVPTFNERENIVLLIPELLALPIEVHVLVVDDNSPDSTGLIVEEMSAKNPRVSAVHRSGKLGLGTAYIAGFKQALAAGSDRILTMDADYSHHPRYIPAMIERSQTADLVIGSRYVRGGGAVDSPAMRRLLSYGANAFAKIMLGLKAMDCTAGFRCYRREVLESIDLDSIFSNGYSFLIEMLYQVQRRGWKVSEVPIQFMDRRLGASKISRNEISRALYTVLRLSAARVLRR